MKLSLKLKIGLALIILLFFVLNFLGFSQNIKSSFYLFSAPLQKVLWQSGEKTANFFNVFSEIRNLKREKELCQLEKQKLLSELAALQALKEENKSFREALNIGLQEEFKLVSVKIIGLDGAGDSLFIDKGEKEGLSKGLVVITGSKVLLGKISNIYAHTSQVKLISHPESSLTGKILQKEVSGLVQGEGNLGLSFKNLPKKEEILPGDIVVTTSLMKIYPPTKIFGLGVYPQGLLIGEISKVQSLDINPFQTAQISPFFGLKKIIQLFVIKEF